MALAALLFAQHADDDDGTEGTGTPHAARMVAGITVIERQVRQVRAQGARRIFILAERMPPRLAAAIELARGGEGDIAVVRAAIELRRNLLVEYDRVLVLDEGLVVDERILAAAVSAERPVIATWPARGMPAGSTETDRSDGSTEPSRAGAERIDASTFAAGVAVLPSDLVRRVSGHVGEWDLQSTLLRVAAGEEGIGRLDLSTIDDYAPARRRRVPLVWAKPADERAEARATDLLLAAAQKGCLDWPARFLHPPIENALVRLLLRTPVTPNMVTVATLLVGIAAGVAFWHGWLWTGLILALLVGPLDGVDGKLARVRFEFSRWGDIEHVVDKLVEYGWYLALARHFARENEGSWAVAAIIILFALAEAVQGEFFRRFTGMQLDDAGPWERRWRLVSGRRNTFFWSLLPFAAFDAWYEGFVFLAAYSALNFFVMQRSFYLHLQRYARRHSEVIESNFRRTAYGFLPRLPRARGSAN